MIKVRIELLVERDGEGFHAFCPELPGLHVGGDTEEEAKKLAVDAAIAYLASLIKHGDPIPLSVTDTHRDSIWSHLKRYVSHAAAKRFVADLSVPVPEPVAA